MNIRKSRLVFCSAIAGGLVAALALTGAALLRDGIYASVSHTF